MIELQRFNGKKFILNAELIETIEASPDTTITLTTGKVFVVRDSVQDVKHLILKYKHNITTYKENEQ